MDCSPAAIAAASRCWCFPANAHRWAMIYLLCQWLKKNEMSCSPQEGAGSPVGVKTPGFIGQLYHDTVADAYYRSTGLTPADWAAIGGGAASFSGQMIGIGMAVAGDAIDTSVSFPNVTTDNGLGIILSSFNLATSINFDQLSGPSGSVQFYTFPLVTSIQLSNLIGVGINFTVSDCPLLPTLNLPSLVSVSGYFEVDNGYGVNTALTSINAPNLGTVSNHIFCAGNPSLVSFVAPNLVPSDGKLIQFQGNALNATSVELILRRCVLAGVTTCTINLSGGTNAGTASLNAQGQADVATLGAQLTINP